MLENLLSRKFILSVMIVIISSALVYFGKIADGVYSSIIIATIASYIAGNVYQKSISETTT